MEAPTFGTLSTSWKQSWSASGQQYAESLMWQRVLAGQQRGMMPPPHSVVPTGHRVGLRSAQPPLKAQSVAVAGRARAMSAAAKSTRARSLPRTRALRQGMAGFGGE